MADMVSPEIWERISREIRKISHCHTEGARKGPSITVHTEKFVIL